MKPFTEPLQVFEPATERVTAGNAFAAPEADYLRRQPPGSEPNQAIVFDCGSLAILAADKCKQSIPATIMKPRTLGGFRKLRVDQRLPGSIWLCRTSSIDWLCDSRSPSETSR